MMMAGATNDSESGGALTGLRVLDLTGRKGGYCGLLLANLGAAVILIEAPGGVPMRSQGPFKNDISHLEEAFRLPPITRTNGASFSILNRKVIDKRFAIFWPTPT